MSGSPSSTVDIPLIMLNALAIKQLTVIDTLVPNTVHYACIYNLVLNVYYVNSPNPQSIL